MVELARAILACQDFVAAAAAPPCWGTWSLLLVGLALAPDMRRVQALASKLWDITATTSGSSSAGATREQVLGLEAL